MKNIILVITTIFLAANVFAQNVEVKIKTSAICGTCKKAIEHDLRFEKGVKEVSLDLDTKVVTVVYNPNKTDEEKIRIAITKIGYDADSIPADSVAYSKLPNCCKKDAPEEHK
jgi:periplasmic mercuric ion binding protein